MFPSKSLCQFVLLSALFAPSLGAFHTASSQLEQKTYDYIIVGAGTAGNVVANRLTEDPNISVLVIEAGGDNSEVDGAHVPPLLGLGLVPGTPYDWNSTTEAMSGLNGRHIAYPRGKVLGGSSSVNHYLYTTGSKDDYNHYAKLTGDDGWNWKNMQQYIKKTEKFIPPADGHDTSSQILSGEPSKSGSVPVSLPGYPTPLDQRILDTTKELSTLFPFNLDMNSGSPLGMGWAQSTIGGGEKINSATVFLAPEYINRANLNVLLNTQVTKLVKTGTKNGLPSFHGVQYSAGGKNTVLHAKNEIIISAGAIGTPHLLMLSGIGDSQELSDVGVKSLVNLPSVGKNMTDHVLLGMVYSVNSDQTFDETLRNKKVLAKNQKQWDAKKTGPLAASISNHLGWFRLPSTANIFKKVADPTVGSVSAHWELILVNFFFGPIPQTGNYLSVVTNLVSPTSRGYIKLKTSNPTDQPLINPNFLATDFDIFAIREAIKASKKFLSAKAWKDYIIGPIGDFAKAKTDADYEAYARNNADTVVHMIGTAGMSPKGAQWGVVDPDLKVKKVEGLRIVDASVIPLVPSGHTQGPVYIFAERAADLIKADAA